MLPEPSQSPGSLQRRIPVWNAARHMRRKRSLPESDLSSDTESAGEEAIDEETLFEEGLGDLDDPLELSESSQSVPLILAGDPASYNTQRSDEHWRSPVSTLEHRPDPGPTAGDSRLEPQGEAAWARRQTVSLWWVLAGAVCIGIVWIFLSRSFDNPIDPVELREPKRLRMNEDVGEDGIAEFVARTSQVLPAVEQVIEKVNRGEGTDLIPLLRGGEESFRTRQMWLDRQPPSTGYYPITERQLYAAVSNGHPYLIMVGLDETYAEAVAYFTSEADGTFKYDWEASEGYSELLPREVDQHTGDGVKLIRGIVLPSSFYPPKFPEEDFQCYTLHHRDQGEFMWLFARRSSEANKRIVSNFSRRVIQGTLGRVTVRVRKGPEGSRANQLELVEFVNSDWFVPVADPSS
ncbi:MAG: hypothetical protein VX633_14120 [Verrucomicrobiota bacterium]|nr:hypothetical protein [Verrucomicrobiota bacterium]